MVDNGSLGSISGKIEIEYGSVLAAKNAVIESARVIREQMNSINRATGSGSGASNAARQEARERIAVARQNTMVMVQLERDRVAGVRQAERDITRMLNEELRIRSRAQREAQQNSLKSQIETARNTGMAGQLGAAGRAALPFSVAAGAASFVGIRNAQSLEQIQLRFEGITGSYQAAISLQERLNAKARDLGLPLNDNLRAIAALTPVLGSNADLLEQYVGLTARLRTLRPEQGLEGAAFAINEAVAAIQSGSTDFISLAERFNISKVALREALEANGNDFSAALSSVLDDMGVTAAQAERFGATGSAAFARVADSVERLLGKAFLTLQPTMTDIATRFADFLDGLQGAPQWLQAAASGALLLATSIAPVLMGAEQLLVAFAAIKTLGMTSVFQSITAALAPLTAALVPLVGALAGLGVGLLAGKEIVTRMADAGVGDQRLRSDSGEDFFRVIGERLAQIYGIMAANLASIFETGGALISNAVNYLANTLTLGASIIQSVFGGLQQVVGTMIVSMVDMINRSLPEGAANTLGISGGLNDLGYFGKVMERDGGGMVQQAAQTGLDAIDAMQRGLALTPEQLQEISATASVAANVASMAVTAGINAIFGSAAEAVSQTQPGGGDTQAKGYITPGFSQGQIEAFETFNAEINKLTLDAIEARLNAEMQFNERRAAIIDQFNEQVLEATQAEALRATRARQDLDQRIAAALSEQRDQEETFRAEELRAEQDHQRALRDIRRDANETIRQAAAGLDANGVYEAQRKKRMDLAEAREKFSIDQRRRAEDFAAQKTDNAAKIEEMRAQFEREEAQRAEDFAIRMEKQENAHREQLAELEKSYQRELLAISTQEGRKRATLEAAFAAEFNQLAAHNGRKLQIAAYGQQLLEQQLQAWYARQSQMMAAAMSSTATASSGAYTYTNANGQTVLVPQVTPYGSSPTMPAGSSSTAAGGNYTLDLTINGDLGQYQQQDIETIVTKSMTKVFEKVAA